MFNFKKHTHKWRTVAVDTSVEWYYQSKPDESYKHIISYQICDGCGERRCDYADPTDKGRDYAENGSPSVARIRIRWVEGGVIKPPKHDHDIEYFDKSYAPMDGFDSYIKAMKNDPELKQMLKDHKMVDDAFGQLEVAIKLCMNNKPQVHTDKEEK